MPARKKAAISAASISLTLARLARDTRRNVFALALHASPRSRRSRNAREKCLTSHVPHYRSSFASRRWCPFFLSLVALPSEQRDDVRLLRFSLPFRHRCAQYPGLLNHRKMQRTARPGVFRALRKRDTRGTVSKRAAAERQPKRVFAEAFLAALIRYERYLLYMANRCTLIKPSSEPFYCAQSDGLRES